MRLIFRCAFGIYRFEVGSMEMKVQGSGPSLNLKENYGEVNGFILFLGVPSVNPSVETAKTSFPK
jgi:hypothetical protein